jgi:hypothetical protein
LSARAALTESRTPMKANKAAVHSSCMNMTGLSVSSSSLEYLQDNRYHLCPSTAEQQVQRNMNTLQFLQ